MQIRCTPYHFSKKSGKGFTFIELLIVMAIIGILATATLISLGGGRAKARDNKRVSDLRAIQTAIELFYQTCGRYPGHISQTSPYNGGCPTGVDFLTFLSDIPRDPSTGNPYSYWASVAAGASQVACTNYHLGASLEAKSGRLSDDGDDPSTSPRYTKITDNSRKCNGSSGNDFSGISAASGGQACSSTDGTAAPAGTETCYDVAP